MTHVTDPDRGDVIRSIIYILIYVIVIGVSAFFLLVQYWYIWLLIVLVGMLLLVNWHKQKTAYQCPNCGYIYELSFLQDFAAPHGFDVNGAWLYLRCPNCGKRSRTKTLKKVD